MSFINEFMTQEEMEEFKAKAIPDPGYGLITLRPYYWTINREENIYLLSASQNRDEPSEHYFVLGWKDFIIPITIGKSWMDKICNWDLIKLDINHELMQDVKCSLKEALLIYGYDGDPNDPNNKIAKIRINF